MNLKCNSTFKVPAIVSYYVKSTRSLGKDTDQIQPNFGSDLGPEFFDTLITFSSHGSRVKH